MLRPVLDGALAGYNCLDEEAEHGGHGKTPVLQLLNLELSKGIGVVSKVEWVEGATWVKWVLSLASWATVDTVSLDQAHEDDLRDEDGKDGLSVDEGGVAQVVEATFVEDLGASLEPDGLSEVDTGVL